MKHVYIAGILAALMLGGCSGRLPPVKAPRGLSCMGMADDLKTLKKGDELPRVLQVLGTPKRAYRVDPWFGTAYDVLEYEISDEACARVLLGSPMKALRVVFDNKGRYLGPEQQMRFKPSPKGTPILIDPVVFKP